jgi:hypothetical protein
MATIAAANVAAIKSFPRKPEMIILGRDKERKLEEMRPTQVISKSADPKENE